MKKYIFIATLICSVMIFSACKTAAEPDFPLSSASNEALTSADGSKSSSSESQFIANPQGAIDEIYLNIDMMGLVDAQDEDVTDRFLIPLDLIEEYSVKYSLGRFGVADVYIIKPTEGNLDEVESKLADIKDTRIREFEKYDVMNSYGISQNAEIYIRGEYVIMVMLDDNEGAKDIIKKYIPN